MPNVVQFTKWPVGGIKTCKPSTTQLVQANLKTFYRNQWRIE